jgi:hypothetical protein
MIEIPRVYRHSYSYAPPNSSVRQPETLTTDSPWVVNEDRRRRRDRRKKKQKPLIERRVSADRRSPMFDAEA